MQITAATLADYRQSLTEILDRLAHRLQAPGLNPGFDSTLSFDRALAEAKRLTGSEAYPRDRQNRELYRHGRVTDDDLEAAFAAYPDLNAGAAIAGTTLGTIYRVALLFDLPPLTDSQLLWQNLELQAFTQLQPDVPEPVRGAFTASGSETEAVGRLWQGLLNKLELASANLSQETPLNLNRASESRPSIDRERHLLAQRQAERELEQLLAELGTNLSLRGMVLSLSGVDILDYVRPQLLRLCASALDTGIAAWHLPECGKRGLYPAWRTTIPYDANLLLHQLPDWQQIVAELPEQALDAISLQLIRLGIPEQRWDGYLQCLAWELPGCSGMISRLQPASEHSAGVTLADYLAIRLVLDRLWLNEICHEFWRVEAKLGALSVYFHKNLSEFLVRQQLYRGQLPEYLAALAETLIIRAGSERQCRGDWQQLADLLHGRCNAECIRHSAADSGWRLFRLCQHLGINADQLQALEKADLLAMLTALDNFNAEARGKIWLYALEHHYRQDLFQYLRANRQRPCKARASRPALQAVFCLDNRAERFRRHLEALHPDLETFGTTGFGLACDHERPTAEHDPDKHVPRGLKNRLRQGLRQIAGICRPAPGQRLAVSFLAINALAPLALLVLIAKSLWPGMRIKALQNRCAGGNSTAQLNHPDRQCLDSLADAAQAELVARFLRQIGMTDAFAQWILLAAHDDENTRQPDGYRCSACRDGCRAAHAQAVAIIANRPAIRARLAGCGLTLPDDTRFIAAAYHTREGLIHWRDIPELPPADQTVLSALQTIVARALQLSVHEAYPSPENAGQNLPVICQPRRSLGHAGNAAAIIGRRSLSEELFLDGRVFLVSYDPHQDLDGALLEEILQAAVPALTAINLDCYVAAMDKNRDGSETTRNLTGWFAAMEGTDSDFRAGLPPQTPANHEAMRLCLLVEARPAVLEAILDRQDHLRALVTDAWLQLAAIEPDSGEMAIFEPGRGFRPL